MVEAYPAPAEGKMELSRFAAFQTALGPEAATRFVDRLDYELSFDSVLEEVP